jgi:23S rRNA (adenine2503-C2)-methyltransferase
MARPASPSRFDLDPEGMSKVIAEVLPGAPRYRTTQLWDALHKRLLDPAEVTELPLGMRAALADHPSLKPALTVERVIDADRGQTRKWLWRLADGARIESVLMLYPNRATVCVSTQAGCAMACSFCATGQAGFSRHLTVGEIVEQVALAARAAMDLDRRVSRVVFMGMGEPLANYDATWAAVQRLHDDMGFSARHLTISTVGVAPGIRRLATEPMAVNLAVSLHAANDTKRDGLIPLNRVYPLHILAEACLEYVTTTHRRLSLEWALIDGVNDTPRDVAELAEFARPLRAHVNLIPLNPTPGYPVRGSRLVRSFQDGLAALGINATVRQTRGRSIDAACGQLAAPTI